MSSNADFVIVCRTEVTNTTQTVTIPGSATAYYATGPSSRTFNFSTKRIQLEAFATSDLQIGKTKAAWRGIIAMDVSDFHKDPASVVRTLLQFFGKDFSGSTATNNGKLP